MIGSAFFLFVFGIFVVSIDQFWQMTLDDAVRIAARQVAIGKVTTGASLVTAVCSEFGVAAPYCSATLNYDVQEAPYFVGTGSGGGITPASLSNGGLSTRAGFPMTLTQSSGTTTPSPMFLLVQVAYPLPFKILIVPGGVATENGTSYLLSTVAAAMEP